MRIKDFANGQINLHNIFVYILGLWNECVALQDTFCMLHEKTQIRRGMTSRHLHFYSFSIMGFLSRQKSIRYDQDYVCCIEDYLKLSEIRSRFDSIGPSFSLFIGLLGATVLASAYSQ